MDHLCVVDLQYPKGQEKDLNYKNRFESHQHEDADTSQRELVLPRENKGTKRRVS